jgi:hypothetical protein
MIPSGFRFTAFTVSIGSLIASLLLGCGDSSPPTQESGEAAGGPTSSPTASGTSATPSAPAATSTVTVPSRSVDASAPTHNSDDPVVDASANSNLPVDASNTNPTRLPCPNDGVTDSGTPLCSLWQFVAWDNDDCASGYTRVRTCDAHYDCRTSDHNGTCTALNPNTPLLTKCGACP